MSFRWSRRRFIQSMGMTVPAVALPVLWSSPLLAAGAPAPRLLVFFSPNGTIYPHWGPTGTGTTYTIAAGSILEPLLPFKAKLNILQGVSYLSEETPAPATNSDPVNPGNRHMKGSGHLLTGVPLLPGTQSGGGGATSGYAGGISVDQYIAQKIGGQTKFPSIEAGVGMKDGGVRQHLAYAGSNQPLPTESDPFKVFQQIFGNATASQAGPAPAQQQALAQRLAESKSILDYAAQDLATLMARLPGDEKVRLDRHLQSIREIETQLVPTALTGSGCSMPTLGPTIDPLATANFPAAGKLQMDIFIAAFACGLTRIGTLQWGGSTSEQQFTWLGINTGHHTMSHVGDSDLGNMAQLVKINNWYAQQFAYLLGKLDAIQEGTGTLLDNSVVAWTNELSKGNTHSSHNIPWVLAGSAGGYFRTGRLIQYTPEQPHNNLLVSFMNAMGLTNETTFGERAVCTGPLTGLI